MSRSLAAWCRAIRPRALRWQLRPWMPELETGSPQTQTCGMQMSEPGRKPAAIRSSLSARCSPRDSDGRVFSQAPHPSALAASGRARVTECGADLATRSDMVARATGSSHERLRFEAGCARTAVPATSPSQLEAAWRMSSSEAMTCCPASGPSDRRRNGRNERRGVG